MARPLEDAPRRFAHHGSLRAEPYPYHPRVGNPARAEPDIVLPSSLATAQVTFGAGAWGAYADIEVATAAAYILTQVHLGKPYTVTGSVWLEIALGQPGSEVPLCVVSEHVFISGTGASPILTCARHVGPYKIPAGSRVRARGWVTAGGNTASRVMLSLLPDAPAWYDPWPTTYAQGQRVTGPHRRDPAVPNWYNLSVSPTWTPIAAAAPNDMLFAAAEWDPANAGGNSGNVLELGVGPAGSEVVYSRIPFPSMGIANWLVGYHTVGRKSLILAGERVAARWARAIGGTKNTALYFEDL